MSLHADYKRRWSVWGSVGWNASQCPFGWRDSWGGVGCVCGGGGFVVRPVSIAGNVHLAMLGKRKGSVSLSGY